MRGTRLKIALAFVGVALGLGILTLIFWDFARSTIITPIYYTVWIGGLVVRSVPQAVFLGVFLLICAAIGLNALAKSMAGDNRRSQQAVVASAETRYHHWERLCSNLYFSRFSRHLFTSEARRLILSVLAFEYRLDVHEVEALVRDGAVDLPETIRALLLGGDDHLTPEQPAGQLTKLARRLRRDIPNDPQVDALLNEIIAFIESHLEIMHVGNQSEPRS